jgi:predicted nuclease of restriction endonuclease-like (RecB) superfamily
MKNEEDKNKRLSLGRTKKEAIYPGAPQREGLPEDYIKVLNRIKKRIGQERIKTVLAANASMVRLYWDIGKEILNRQNKEGWGTRIIDRLSADLKNAYPDMKGFSPRNLKYMRAFAAAWRNPKIVQRVVAQLPWRQNIALIERLTDKKKRLWYADQTIKNGWSQPILCMQIEKNAHKRQGKAITNFPKTMSPPDSDIAAQVFKDPYLFDFLGTADPRKEAEVEQALVDHVQKFLLELGKGFAFVGRQVHLEVGDDDFYIDLLFYHLNLRCYIVIELKAVPFDAGFVGKLNFYLSAVDDLLKHPEDKPTIGLLLCKSKNRIVVEYALRGFKKPIGVAQWETKIVKSLPRALKGSLPSIKEMEKEFGRKKNK